MIFRILPILLLGCTTDLPECTSPESAPGDGALVFSDHTLDFTGGTLSVLDLDSLQVCNRVATATADSVVAVGPNDTVVEVGRLGTDRIRLYTPGEWQRPDAEFSVGPGSNPQDAAWCADRWWVSQLASPSLRAFSPPGEPLDAIDLSAYADADGIPELKDLVVQDQVLTVSAQRLNRADAFSPTDAGALVHIDCSSGQILHTAQTQPNLSLSEGLDGLISSGADGIFRWSDDWERTQIATFDDPVVGSAFVESGHGIATTVTEGGWYKLHCVDPNGATTPLAATAAYVPDLQSNDRDEVWAAVRTSYADPESAPQGWTLFDDLEDGLLLIDPTQCQISASVATRLGPYSIDFY
ncbi:MAG: hypothetical protein AB8H79_16975 [Myxococcota bacterium]